MSVCVFFGFATGISKPIRYPKGTKARLVEHVRHVESALGLTQTKYLGNPIHWDAFKRNEAFAKVDDKTLCREVEAHNSLVRWFYDRLEEWSKKPAEDGEVMTPEDAQEFWHGLELLDVPPERWTAEYYQSRMEALYGAMRGRRHESEGMILNAKTLTPEQADAVICLFAGFLDTHDIRLAVPVGHDCLKTGDEYGWCSKCGAIDDDEIGHRVRHCRKKGGCPLRDDYGADFED